MSLFVAKRDELRTGDQEPGGIRFGVSNAEEPARLLRLCPAYEATRVVPLENLARTLGIRELILKDESTRLGLQSFKALGGAYAVIKTVLDRSAIGNSKNIQLADPSIRSTAEKLTFATATDGNHGRSVAAAARLVGARAIIYLPESASRERRDAIAGLGAELIETSLGYDDTVRLAEADAVSNGWILMSDTSTNVADQIAETVMLGYCVIVHELTSQVDLDQFSHIFMQGGVGGFAAALMQSIADACSNHPPKFVIVEPESANCLQVSAQRAMLSELSTPPSTSMAMLECGKPSAVAWEVIRVYCDAYMTINDNQANEVAQSVFNGVAGDPPIDTSPSGIAGLAGLILACEDPNIRSALDIHGDSIVLVINTEGRVDDLGFVEVE